MSISINTIAASGSILLWLGVIIFLAGIILFLAVCGGIAPAGLGDDLHTHDTYFILIHGIRRMIYILPLIAGLVLICSGVSIRRQVPSLEAMLTNIPQQNEEAEQDAP
jgi:hypothetical protein